jgi:hypothetical protein
MISPVHSILVYFMFAASIATIEGFSPSHSHLQNQQQLLPALNAHANKDEEDIQSRRKMLASSLISLSTIMIPLVSPANARYVLNEETGDYDEVTDEDWQTAWKQRAEKAQSMSKDEIFNAARGAGNTDLREGEESDASKKRRAMSACRDSVLREKAGLKDVKSCNSRVFSGDVDLINNILGQI